MDGWGWVFQSQMHARQREAAKFLTIRSLSATEVQNSPEFRVAVQATTQTGLLCYLCGSLDAPWPFLLLVVMCFFSTLPMSPLLKPLRKLSASNPIFFLFPVVPTNVCPVWGCDVILLIFLSSWKASGALSRYLSVHVLLWPLWVKGHDLPPSEPCPCLGVFRPFRLCTPLWCFKSWSWTTVMHTMPRIQKESLI